MNDDLKPISLVEAAKILAARYPEYAFDRQQLRRMCITGKIPHVARPICGMKRTMNYFVRMKALLHTFRSWEKPALKWK